MANNSNQKKKSEEKLLTSFPQQHYVQIGEGNVQSQRMAGEGTNREVLYDKERSDALEGILWH